MTEEEKKTQRKPMMILVKVIEGKGKSVLVEWLLKSGDPRRAYVPADKLIVVEEGTRCDKDTLDQGIPYGAPWEELIDLSGLTPQAMAKQLRRRGIWNSADIETNMQGVQRAINQATGLTPASLHTLASQYEAKKEA